MNIDLEQSQKQILSQNMIQSVNILQMSSLELSDYMHDISLENPVLDLGEPAPPNNQKEELQKKLEWLESLDEQNRTYFKYDKEDMQKDIFSNLKVSQKETLSDILLQQLLGQGYSDFEMEIFEYIAESLDSSGYFKVPLREFAYHFHLSEEKAWEYWNIMKELEPAGICAKDLTECLMIQLKKREQSTGLDLSLPQLIVRDYLELVGKNQLNSIANQTGIAISVIKEACDTIKSLNPRPASGYNTGEMTQYIVPDVTIVKFKNRFEILINNYSYPVVHMNTGYVNILKSTDSSEVQDYLMHKVNQVKHLQDYISKRNTTLLNLSRCIVDAQIDFFLYGKNALKPFKMSEAAKILDVHESTISRAVKSKYLQCCWGLYPLSYFFQKGFDSHSSSAVHPDIATVHIKEELKKIIDSENKNKPYSDQQISVILKQQGMSISRRTVAKYRESLGIPSGQKRKEF